MTGMTLQDAVGFLEETPATVSRLVAGLSGEELKWKADGERFSFVEHVCHLRDIEREGYEARIKRLLAENRPQLEDIDGARLAAERRYQQQDFASGFDAFARARRGNVETLRELSPEQLRRSGTLEGVGEVSLEKLISLMCEHDRDHREEMSVLREKLVRERAAGL